MPWMGCALSVVGGWADHGESSYRFCLARGRGSALDASSEWTPRQALSEVVSSSHILLSILQDLLQLVCGERHQWYEEHVLW